MNVCTKTIGFLALTVVTAPAFAGVVYTDSTSFLNAADAGISLNTFDELVNGPSPDLSYTIGAFSYEISAGGGYGTGLYNDTGIVSTQNSNDYLLVTFTSNNVTAVGGNFWGTSEFFGVVLAQITITLSDGTEVSFDSAGPSVFRGFSTDAFITSMTIDAKSATGAWATMDNLYVGTAVVPLPAAAWAGLGTLGLLGGLRTYRRRA